MTARKYLVTADAVGIPGEPMDVPPVPVAPPTTAPTYAYRNQIIELEPAVAKDLIDHGVIKPIDDATDEEKAAAEERERQIAENSARVEREAAQEKARVDAALAAEQERVDAQKAAEQAQGAAQPEAGASEGSTATDEEKAAAAAALADAKAADKPTAKQALLIEADDLGLEITGTAAELQARIDGEKALRGDGD